MNKRTRTDPAASYERARCPLPDDGVALFGALPQALARDLLSLLDHRALSALARTSRAMRSLCYAEDLWRAVHVANSAEAAASLAGSGRAPRAVGVRPAFSTAAATGATSCNVMRALLTPPTVLAASVREVRVADDPSCLLGRGALTALAAHDGLTVLDEEMRALGAARGAGLRELSLSRSYAGEDAQALLYGLADAARPNGGLPLLEKLRMRMFLEDMKALRTLLATGGGGPALPALRVMSSVSFDAGETVLAPDDMFTEQVDFLVLLSASCPALEELEVSGLLCVSALPRFSLLKTLDFPESHILCTALLHGAVSSPLSLEALSLRCVCADPVAASQCDARMAALLSLCPRVTSLKLETHVTGMPPAVAAAVARLQRLERLSLVSEGEFSDEALEALSHAEARPWELRVSNANWGRLLALPLLSRLRSVRTGNHTVCDGDLFRLADCCGSTLRSVALELLSNMAHGQPAPHAGMSLLVERCPRLRLLTIYDCSLDDLVTCARYPAFGPEGSSGCRLKVSMPSERIHELSDVEYVALMQSRCAIDKIRIEFDPEATSLPRGLLRALQKRDMLHALCFFFVSAKSVETIMCPELCSLLPRSLAKFKVYPNGAVESGNQSLCTVAQIIHHYHRNLRFTVPMCIRMVME
eukprot:m51a1_g5789 hypothetical protein (647) ;mRNA; f:31455-34180